MYPAKFDYYRASSVAEAVSLLQTHEDAKLLAGGHSLLPMMKLRLAQPSALIDLGAISDLRGVDTSDGGAIKIGAMTTYAEVAAIPAANALTDACSIIGDVQVRNRGTIGGSLAHNDPAGDLPAVALALGAKVETQGPNGSRTIPADEFIVGLLETSLQTAEIVTAVHFPAMTGGSAYEKAENPASGYAICGVAAWVRLDGGTISECRIGITGAADHATRLHNVESKLMGREPSDANIEAAVSMAGDGLMFNTDIHADEGYRANLTKVLTAKALKRAIERA